MGKGRPNPLNQYNLFRPGTYIIVILAQKKKKIFAPIENTKAVNTASASTPVNCSSTAHLLPVQLKVVIINKMKNEPVREQFSHSHCAKVWARYPPQALRVRDVKGRL